MINIKISQLDQTHLEGTIDLLDLVFPIQDELENADSCLRASLDYEKYKETLKEWRIPKLEYLIAIDKKSNKVIATSGIYEMEGDHKSAWIGWTSTHPDFRRQGIGKMMLKNTLEIMKQRDYKIAKLHTVDIEDQKNAHKLYEKAGFKLKRRDPKAEIGHDRLYYEKSLMS